jgi:glutathione S-transferase
VTAWQDILTGDETLDGTIFQFPKAVAYYRDTGKYDKVFGLYEAVKSRPRLAAYFASDRRHQFSMGIYRHYPELDLVPEPKKDEEKK